uniref:CSON005431 protein n=1 Tax=Culicoides sonorensis TaxID=179676 RepID=A0A336MRF7_CULSO
MVHNHPGPLPSNIPAIRNVNAVPRLQLRANQIPRGGEYAGKRKFDGSHPNQIDVKRRFPNTILSQWGCQPLSQQPLDSNGGDQWYTDAYSSWT